ncbi:unnamed protein product [Ambrosiozyma monospora]|uniref:Unnamed protein product n=1 Tax=Ambrosiozyma monospora TaxID=43982 RepID=A0ACB5T3T1_AMBMO|nr:unnamed protein product [Ambrosiozyma monospora]
MMSVPFNLHLYLPFPILALLLYLGLLSLFNIAFHGRLFIGFISWLKIHYFKLNLKHTIITIRSISVSFNFSAFFFPNANGSNSTFIDLRFDGFSVKLLQQNQSPNNSGNHNNNNDTHNISSRSNCHFGNLFKKVANILSYCPISVSIYGLSIQGPRDTNNTQEYLIDIGKINFVTDCLVNSTTECSELNFDLDLSDFTTSSPDQNFSKSLKVKAGFISPYTEFDLSLRNTFLSIHCGDSKFDIPLLNKTFESLFPKHIEKHNIIEEDGDDVESIPLTTSTSLEESSDTHDHHQLEHEQHKISSILEKFEIRSVNVFLDEINITTSTLSLSLSNTKAQLEGLDQDKSTTYFSKYKGSLSLDQLELSPCEST